MVLKFPCCLIHYLYRILLLFHFGRMYRSRNQNCYCNSKIFHFRMMLWSWNKNYCHWPPHSWIQFPFGVKLLCWNWYPCFREYFSLGGCIGLRRYNIFGYCTAVIVVRFYFILGWCVDVRMSNAICGGVVIPLSLELAQWYCGEVLFSMMAFSRAHHWQIASEVLV